jgi:putative phosphoesterase
VRIGLLSDTHLPGERRVLWDEVRHAFEGVDLILHGGDIVLPSVLDWLEEIAPTLAARGNNDMGWDDPRVQDTQWLDIEGFRLAMVHDMEPETQPIAELTERYLGGEHADIIVTGHTHYERLDYRDGVLQINSGSPTHPRLWSTRLGTIGLLEIERDSLVARIAKLGESPDLRNPACELHFDLRDHRTDERQERRPR